MRGRGRTIEATLQGLCEFWFGLINIFMINAPAVATFVPCFLLLGSILAFTLVTLGLTLAMPTACQVLQLAATFIDPSYMVRIVYVIIWVDRNLEAQRKQATTLLSQLGAIAAG